MTPIWTLSDLNTILKNLKNNKVCDAYGHVFELFKFGIKVLKISLLNMYKLMKSKQVYPQTQKPTNITSLYKGKGERSNEHGIFNAFKIQYILEKMI